MQFDWESSAQTPTMRSCRKGANFGELGRSSLYDLHATYCLLLELRRNWRMTSCSKQWRISSILDWGKSRQERQLWGAHSLWTEEGAGWRFPLHATSAMKRPCNKGICLISCFWPIQLCSLVSLDDRVENSWTIYVNSILWDWWGWWISCFTKIGSLVHCERMKKQRESVKYFLWCCLHIYTFATNSKQLCRIPY